MIMTWQFNMLNIYKEKTENNMICHFVAPSKLYQQFSLKVPIVGGRLGFGNYFKFCNHENVYVGHIPLIPCMTMCELGRILQGQ